MKRNRNFADKPYNRCLFCEYLGDGCDGPRTSSMPTPRWSEFMRDVKDLRGLTNQSIAEMVGLSVKTVERIMSGKADDVYRGTAGAIENAVIGSKRTSPCYLALLEDAPDLEKALESKINELEIAKGSIQRLNDELNLVRREAQEKIDYLRRENEKKDKIIEKLLEK